MIGDIFDAFIRLEAAKDEVERERVMIGRILNEGPSLDCATLSVLYWNADVPVALLAENVGKTVREFLLWIEPSHEGYRSRSARDEVRRRAWREDLRRRRMEAMA
jgi:hypothetical protein